MKKKFRYIVEVEIDEDKVVKDYPNYRFNYSKPSELADSLIMSIKEPGTMKSFGFEIKVKKDKNKL